MNFFILIVDAEAQDGLLGGADSKAKEWIAEFVADRELSPKTYAVVGSAGTFAYRSNSKKIYEREHWFVIASISDRKTNKDKRLHAFSVLRAGAGEGYWEQTLIEDGIRYVRRGSPFGKGASGGHEDVDEEVSDVKMSRVMPRFDPYFLPIADEVSFLSSSIKANYGLKLLQMMEFERAEFNKQGELEAEWCLNESETQRLQITFSPKHGNKPVQALWWTEKRGEDGKVVKDISTTVATRWHHTKFGKKSERVWVPVEIRRSHFFDGSASHSDYVFRLEWRTIEKSSFPKSSDDDWRLELSKRFEVDWELPWQSFRPYDLEF